ncbi:MAG: hypothetical protein JO130_11745 [Solirubrobacterales bacterium]|nr:hypothetical protein [Solirubrobacterales bacterium]
MSVLATPIVDWSAMWKICVVALTAGAGVVVAFGFLLLGLQLANGARAGGFRLGGYALSAVCGVLCLGVIVVGVYAMTKKPKSKPAKPKAAALVIPAGPPVKLLASSRGS